MRNPNTKITKARLMRLVAEAGPHFDFGSNIDRPSRFRTVINGVTGNSVQIIVGRDTNLTTELALDSIRSPLRLARDEYMATAIFEGKETQRVFDELAKVFAGRDPYARSYQPTTDRCHWKNWPGK